MRIENSLNKKALVSGAGGVSPSVILSIRKSGIKNIFITNRTYEKCIFLKKKFHFLNIIPWLDLKSEIKNFDIIVDGSDNFKTKFLLNEYSLKYKKILIVGAISKFDGHIFSFNFNIRKTSCLKCFYQTKIMFL